MRLSDVIKSLSDRATPARRCHCFVAFDAAAFSGPQTSRRAFAGKRHVQWFVIFRLRPTRCVDDRGVLDACLLI